MKCVHSIMFPLSAASARSRDILLEDASSLTVLNAMRQGTSLMPVAREESTGCPLSNLENSMVTVLMKLVT